MILPVVKSGCMNCDILILYYWINKLIRQKKECHIAHPTIRTKLFCVRTVKNLFSLDGRFLVHILCPKHRVGENGVYSRTEGVIYTTIML